MLERFFFGLMVFILFVMIFVRGLRIICRLFLFSFIIFFVFSFFSIVLFVIEWFFRVRCRCVMYVLIDVRFLWLFSVFRYWWVKLFLDVLVEFVFVFIFLFLWFGDFRLNVWMVNVNVKKYRVKNVRLIINRVVGFVVRF